jgi:cell division transport system permease protein
MPMTETSKVEVLTAPVSKRPAAKSQVAIVPRGSIAGRALAVVVAIMTFLACLTLGAVLLVSESARAWQSQISREATIQIKPGDFDMEVALAKAADLARGFDGVTAASVIDLQATGALLEPWLGLGFDLNELPVPRLVIVTIDESNPPDFAAMAAQVGLEIPNATLDDHRKWVDRLVTMARTTATIGIAVLALVLSATALTVVFATRGAMVGSGHIIEVLHFVGAKPGFIAAEFRRHFILTGLAGAAIGGATALALFGAIAWWAASNRTTPEADQMAAMFGNVGLGYQGLAAVAAIVIAIVAIAAATSHITVMRHLAAIGPRGR